MWLSQQHTKSYQETIIVQDASSELIVVPATYRTVSETIVVQEATTDLVAIPATYKTVS